MYISLMKIFPDQAAIDSYNAVLEPGFEIYARNIDGQLLFSYQALIRILAVGSGNLSQGQIDSLLGLPEINTLITSNQIFGWS